MTQTLTPLLLLHWARVSARGQRTSLQAYCTESCRTATDALTATMPGWCDANLAASECVGGGKEHCCVPVCV